MIPGPGEILQITIKSIPFTVNPVLSSTSSFSQFSLRSAKSSIRIYDAIYGCLPAVGYFWLRFNALFRFIDMNLFG
jgi:hypothetical protein